MTCATLEKLLKQGTATPSRVLEDHVLSCPNCQRDDAVAEQAWEAWHAQPDRVCLTTREVIDLLESSGGNVTDQQRRMWRHVVSCDICAPLVRRARQGLAPSRDLEEEPTPLPFERVWAAIQAAKKKKDEVRGLLVFAFVGAGVKRQLECRKHDRVMPKRARSFKDASDGELSIPDYFVPLDGFRLEIKAVALPQTDGAWRLTLLLLPENTDQPHPDFWVSLTAGGEDELARLRLNPGTEKDLPAQPPGDYWIIVRKSDEVAGEINVQVR